VSRMALAAVSLVAAIPAGIMAALGIMAFLSHTEHMNTILMATTGAATAMGVLIALSPVVILVGKRRTAPAAVKAAKSEPVPTGTSGAQTAEIVTEGQEAEDLSGEAAFSDAVEDTEAMESSSEIAQTDDFQFEDDAFAGDELAEAEPEPEPEPKKKKKKK